MPLPSTAVVPDGWDDHHRPVATATMTATCTITRPTQGAYDPITLQYPANTEPVAYRGPCRLQQVIGRGRDAPLDFAGQPVTARINLVSIEWDAAPVHINDIVTIDDSVDPRLIGRKVRVTNVVYGSMQWQRDLHCQDFDPA